ncbi:hypothetical protein J5U22_00702 [Saccharolobus shibatae]|uniref:Uncharacterized protein n=1 Tax=Saccharolobus shibatae TaxID=2286 RepID=A0A8F5GZ34_9CREN|nr:hypothetical protein J5U22_00702 [Saccharolobus shibatae]
MEFALIVLILVMGIAFILIEYPKSKVAFIILIFTNRKEVIEVDIFIVFFFPRGINVKLESE